MSNWVRISNEELEKSKEIIGLKKGELQIELVKALVKIDKAIEYMNSEEFILLMMSSYNENENYFKAKKNLLEILGDSNE